jgi:hypothetical protein
VAAKVAGQLAGKAGAGLVPFLGAAVSSAISYWVASSLLTAAESYYRNEYVQFDGLSVVDLIEGAVEGGVKGPCRRWLQAEECSRQGLDAPASRHCHHLSSKRKRPIAEGSALPKAPAAPLPGRYGPGIGAAGAR